MQDALALILKIQEFDIKMIRLMRVKRERQKELEKIKALKSSMDTQVVDKEKELMELKKEIRLGETQVKELQEKVTRLETQSMAVKKMDEFNALTQEITQAGRERTALEARLSDLVDKQAAEEDLLVALKEKCDQAEKNSTSLEKEIHATIEEINREGEVLLKEREVFAKQAHPEAFKIYERLLKNKKDRVIVPIENRICMGCHILLTAQHENLVRKGDRLVFCEHCSRILYWQEAQGAVEEEGATPTRRRRRRVTV